MQRKFQHVISWPGALSNATYTFSWTVPSDCTLVHISSCQSNATAASSWILGTSADTNGWITAGSFGVSGTPIEYDTASEFDGALVTGTFPRATDGTIVRLTITGTAANQATDGMMVFTFVEG